MGKPGLSATVRVFTPAFFRKIITRHDTGLGEAYMDADFEVCLPIFNITVKSDAKPHSHTVPSNSQSPAQEVQFQSAFCYLCEPSALT
jgi:hypothetical protein